MECKMIKIVLILVVSSLALMAFDGKKAYKQCAMCHGKKGEKVAMKSSPKLNALSQDQLVISIKALLDGSSSVSSKYLGLHKKKLKKVQLEDVKSFAEYISGLK